VDLQMVTCAIGNSFFFFSFTSSVMLFSLENVDYYAPWIWKTNFHEVCGVWEGPDVKSSNHAIVVNLKIH
ncbi:MAG: hypothetical protein KAQ71_01000, partial [Desulfobulbaceae bacterium]|nr:hypothetical protein [Desulfobulbaceae bacterium]